MTIEEGLVGARYFAFSSAGAPRRKVVAMSEAHRFRGCWRPARTGGLLHEGC